MTATPSERDTLAVFCKGTGCLGWSLRDESDGRSRAVIPRKTPLITAGMGGMQEDGIAMEGLKRGVAALDDLDTVAQLKKAL